ncbi:MAG: nucleoside diphosphate kinase regulator [Candidatus Eisenbacteria bacterium]|nr:nucleoside diphosphate kinase regulator [Candidatus Eisenbacteria bacterium]
MKEKRITVTEHDALRLRNLIGTLAARRGADRRALEPLRGELDRADIVKPTEVDPRVVTMQSRVRLRDEDSGEELDYTLVYPDFADLESGQLSVLAPIGTAIFGGREGDVVQWNVPAGTRRFRIVQVLFQPEAAGQEQLKLAAASVDEAGQPGE